MERKGENQRFGMSLVRSRRKEGQTETRNGGLPVEVARARDPELVVVQRLKSACSDECWVEVKRDIWIDSATTKSVSDGTPVELEAEVEERKKGIASQQDGGTRRKTRRKRETTHT